MPSISGASWTVRPRPGRVHQHLAPLAHQQVPPRRRDPVLQLGALAEPLQGQLGRHLIGQVGGMGPRLVGEREEPGPVQLGLGQELAGAGRGRARSRPGSRG